MANVWLPRFRRQELARKVPNVATHSRAALHPQHVHWGRREERQMAAEDKLYYRLQAGLAGSHPYGTQEIQADPSPAC